MRKLFILILSILVFGTTYAGGPFISRNRIVFGGYVGASTFAPNWKFFEPSVPGLNFRGSLAYLYYFNTRLGIYCGVEAGYFGGGVNMEHFETESHGYIDVSDGNSTMTIPATFNTFTQDIKERYHSLLLTIPLQCYLQTNEKEPIFFRGGFKLAFPLTLSATYQYGKSEFGVGPEIDGTGTLLDGIIPRDTHEEMHGTYGAQFNNPFAVLGAVEVGLLMKYRSHHRHYIHGKIRRNYYFFGLSFYMDVPLWELKDASSGDFISYSHGNWNFSNLIQSNVIDKMGYFSMGVKLTWDFGFGEDAPRI